MSDATIASDTSVVSPIIPSHLIPSPALPSPTTPSPSPTIPSSSIYSSLCVCINNDFAKIIVSIALFISFTVFGIALAVLGSSMPYLTKQFNVTTSQMSFSFTFRGLGFVVGALSSSRIANYPKVAALCSKSFIVAIAVLITGIGFGITQGITSYSGVMFLYTTQGFCFGYIETLSNTCITELWDNHSQPWMQALHAFFGIGAIIGPALIGAVGFKATYIGICSFSFLPMLFLLCYYFIKEKEVNATETESKTAAISSIFEKTTTTADDKVPPISIKALITTFFFLYVGAEAAYGGWITTYVLEKNITDSKSHAAFSAAIFWAFLTAGRLAAILLAVYFTPTLMMRVQLAISLVGAMLVVTIASTTLTNVMICSAIFGLGLSSIYPLAMTLVNDWGYVVDGNTITVFVIGSCLGDALVPMFVGIAMHSGIDSTPDAMIYSIIVLEILMIITYLASHHIGSNNNKLLLSQKKTKLGDDENQIELI